MCFLKGLKFINKQKIGFRAKIFNGHPQTIIQLVRCFHCFPFPSFIQSFKQKQSQPSSLTPIPHFSPTPFKNIIKYACRLLEQYSKNRTTQVMSIALHQKYKQIFQVKIKQQRLCQLLQSFSIKIHHLEDSQRALQANISMNNILDEVKKYVKALVKEENTQMMCKFYEKIDSCTKDINRVEYSYKNFEKNIRADFEGLNEKERLLEKTVSYMNVANSQLTAKLKGEIENVQQQLGNNKVEVLNELQAEKQKVSEGHEKINALTGMLEDGEEKLDYFQETLISLSKKVNQFKQHDSNIAKIDAEKDKNHLLSSQVLKKSRTSARRTIDSSQFKPADLLKEREKEIRESKELRDAKSPKQSRDIKQNDISSIAKKIETLEKKVSVIMDGSEKAISGSQNERDSILSTTQIAQIAQLSKFNSTKNMERFGNKASPIRKSNNYKRGSICTQEAHESAACIEDHSKSIFANTNPNNSANTNQIRRINEKLTNIHFKYTLLQENYDSLLGKINRLSGLEAVIQGKIEEAEKMRVDANTVNEIKLRFKQIQAAMELQEIRYVNHNTYQKQADLVRKKLAEIDSSLPKLAKKDEVVAAFAFIENKIKEIVTVLSTKFQQDKLGAINKIQNIRCLTCDKQANLADLARPNRNNIRTSQATRFDRHQLVKRFKTEQAQ